MDQSKIIEWPTLEYLRAKPTDTLANLRLSKLEWNSELGTKGMIAHLNDGTSSKNLLGLANFCDREFVFESYTDCRSIELIS